MQLWTFSDCRDLSDNLKLTTLESNSFVDLAQLTDIM